MPTSLAAHSAEASSEKNPEERLIRTGLEEETHMTVTPSTSATSDNDMGEEIKDGKSSLTATSDISVVMPTSLAAHSAEASSEKKPEERLIRTGLEEETHMTVTPSTSATSDNDMGEEIKGGKSSLTDCEKVTEADNRSKQMDLESEESSIPESNKCDSERTESCKESTCHT